MIYSVCTNSSACDGSPNVSGDKGYCDFAQGSNGICQFCSDVSNGCSGTTNGERDCKEICGGKHCNFSSILEGMNLWEIHYGDL